MTMRAYQTQQTISASHTLTLQLPPEVPVGLAQVIVLYPDVPSTEPTPAVGTTAAGANDLGAFLAMLDALPPSGRSAEEIEQQILDERNAWE
jgi:hypothetical protein